MTENKKNCRWLKAIDQNGHPVTLNWKKDNVHITHLGGICTILSVMFVGAFTIGILLNYFQFNNYDQLTLEKHTVTDSYNINGCDDANANCTTVENTQWIPFVTIGDNNKVNENLSNYVIPQFYTFEISSDGEQDIVFYDAIDCSSIFANVMDADLEKELKPLWNGAKWLCPDLKEINFKDEPWT